MQEVELSKEEIQDGAPFAALSYCLFLWILTFIFKKENRFARFHARQGIIIFMGEIAFMFLSLLPIIGALFYVFGLILFLVLSMAGIYYSLTGTLKKLPIVGKISEKLVI